MMTLAEYCADIKFNLIQPHTRGIGLLTMEQVGIDIDFLNTEEPEGGMNSTPGLSELLEIPRMSTYAMSLIINRCVRDMNESHSFVNVGVWNGFTLLSGMHGNMDKACVGIDNFSEFGGPREHFLARFNAKKHETLHRFHDVSYQDFFKDQVQSYPSIGFYIYDGDHAREHQFQGLMVAEPYLADNALILVDDINFPQVVAGTNDFFAASKFKYENIFTGFTANNCHPTFWNGVSLFRKVS